MCLLCKVITSALSGPEDLVGQHASVRRRRASAVHAQRVVAAAWLMRSWLPQMLRLPAVACALLSSAVASGPVATLLRVDVHKMLVNYCRHGALVMNEHGCVTVMCVCVRACARARARGRGSRTGACALHA
jgi:hypothetical protein